MARLELKPIKRWLLYPIHLHQDSVVRRVRGILTELLQLLQNS